MTTDIISDIITREGGFVDRAADKGGATKYGVTEATLSAWRRHPCQAVDVKNLTETEARQILTELFLTRPGFTAISDAKVRAFAADWGVNSGPATAIKALQTAVGIAADGTMGPRSVTAVNAADPARLFNRMVAARMQFIGHIITRNPSQAEFAEGWLTRLGDFLI